MPPRPPPCAGQTDTAHDARGCAKGFRLASRTGGNRPQPFDQLSRVLEPPQMRIIEHVLSDWLDSAMPTIEWVIQRTARLTPNDQQNLSAWIVLAIIISEFEDPQQVTNPLLSESGFGSNIHRRPRSLSRSNAPHMMDHHLGDGYHGERPERGLDPRRRL